MGQGPLCSADRGRRLAPFGAALLLGLAVSPMTPTGAGTALSGVLAAALLAVSWFAPWARLPVWSQALPFYLALPVIGLLRHANGGPLSGYAPLALLPVLWLALHFGRRELLIGLGVLAATFVTPLVLLEGTNLAGGWRLTLLLVLTAGVVGFTTCDLTDQLRHRAADLRAIGRAARELPTDDSAREAVCRVAREVSGADLALLLEPDRRGWRLHATASYGVDVPVSIPLGGTSAVVEAFRSRSPRFVADCARRPSAGAHLHAETGAASLYAQPVVRGEAVVGVLVVGYRTPRSRMPQRLVECFDVITAEASLAFERADLLARLASAAHTDGLTGAANRRGWELAVRNDLEPATGTARVVALLDLDHFKRYNDTFGHQAGDELLIECVRRWREVLRAGDTLARWGGEEFAVLLPGCDEQQAAPVLDRLRASVPFGCTVSAGVTLSYGGEAPAAVMARADAALYAAKRSGRDRAVWHDEAVVDLHENLGVPGAPVRVTSP